MSLSATLTIDVSMIAMIRPSITVIVISATDALARARKGLDMKLLLEILIAIFLHPVAWILVLIDLAGRDDLTTAQLILWGAVSIVWGIGPILYIMFGNGELW